MMSSRYRYKNRKWLFVLAGLLMTSCSAGNSSPGLGSYPKAVSAVDEAAAIQTLRTIATAEGQSRAAKGTYGDFNSLVQAGFLDQRFASSAPVMRGYQFTLTAGENDFSVNADPQTSETQPAAGGRHFYLDSTDNAIHANSTQRASRNDPSL